MYGKTEHRTQLAAGMWPVFGVYGSPKRVEMELVTGQDVSPSFGNLIDC